MNTAVDKRTRPVRRGALYCSPWCGGGCTYEAFQRATAKAAELCARLGDGWKPRVWENLGWHYAARKGVATMYGPGIHERYWVSFDSSAQITGEGSTPEEALRAAIEVMRTIFTDALAMLAEAEGVVGQIHGLERALPATEREGAPDARTE